MIICQKIIEKEEKREQRERGSFVSLAEHVQSRVNDSRFNSSVPSILCLFFIPLNLHYIRLVVCMAIDSDRPRAGIGRLPRDLNQRRKVILTNSAEAPIWNGVMFVIQLFIDSEWTSSVIFFSLPATNKLSGCELQYFNFSVVLCVPAFVSLYLVRQMCVEVPYRLNESEFMGEKLVHELLSLASDCTPPLTFLRSTFPCWKNEITPFFDHVARFFLIPFLPPVVPPTFSGERVRWDQISAETKREGEEENRMNLNMQLHNQLRKHWSYLTQFPVWWGNKHQRKGNVPSRAAGLNLKNTLFTFPRSAKRRILPRSVKCFSCPRSSASSADAAAERCEKNEHAKRPLLA